MADIYGQHFNFGGISSRYYNLIIANVETSRYKALSGSINARHIFNRANKKQYLLPDDYSESPMSFDLDIVTDTDYGLQFDEIREIEKWLFKRSWYRKLYFEDPECDNLGGLENSYINCRFISPEKIEVGEKVIGFKVTMETDSPFMWENPIVKEFEINNGSSSRKDISVFVDTDIDGYTYPIVTIQAGSSGGEIYLVNHSDSDSRQTKFVSVPTSARIILNGNMRYVSGDYFNLFSNRNFPRLLDGENKLSVYGNVSTISFEWQNKRRL